MYISINLTDPGCIIVNCDAKVCEIDEFMEDKMIFVKTAFPFNNHYSIVLCFMPFKNYLLHICSKVKFCGFSFLSIGEILLEYLPENLAKWN